MTKTFLKEMRKMRKDDKQTTLITEVRTTEKCKHPEEETK